jgi:two-component system response regulator AtoC
MKKTVLIVDDEKNTREGLFRALSGRHRVLLADSAERALEILGGETVDVLLSDIRMPGMDGITLMQRARARTPQPVCILMTAYGNVETAVEAMKLGAYDFLTKPISLDRLDLLMQRALGAQEMAVENRNLREQLERRYGVENILGESPAMQTLLDTIRQVAPSRATVLIEGESGTGKELVARAIHQLSPRAQGPLISVHCAALSPTLLESELFGHERGAFTGATDMHRGRFELADGGSLFLDEIGEIDPSVQVKILRVLEEHRFERVGGQKTLEVSVRLIAATNRNLAALVEAGKFRKDLFYRLNVVSILLPPLRERPGDIPLLAARFVREFAEENGKPLSGMTSEAMEALQSHSWPGNVRQLRNVIERMVVLSRGDRLTLRDIPSDLRETGAGASGPPALRLGKGATLAEAERALIVQALDASHGHRARAARQLGISRRTLHRKLNEYGLREEPPDRPPPAGSGETPQAST